MEVVTITDLISTLDEQRGENAQECNKTCFRNARTHEDFAGYIVRLESLPPPRVEKLFRALEAKKFFF